MAIVTSKDNAALKSARKLRTKSGRDKEGAFLAEGEKLIREAVSAELALKLILLRGEEAEAPAIRGEDGGPRTLRVSEALYDEIAGTVTPQPVMAVIEKPKTSGLPASVKTALVLDRIQDPGNAGALVRTAFAAGADAVLCIKGTADLWSDKAVRGAAGALFKLPVIEGLSAEEAIRILQSRGLRMIVLDAGGMDYSDTDLSSGIALVVGNEGSGASEVFRRNADTLAGIPMREGSESLNAGAAAAVVLYEKRRQDLYKMKRV